MTLVGIIPARSGSKSVPNKNIRLLDGLPLFVHTLRAALKSSIFDSVYVSTDSQHYLELGLSYGSSPVSLRPQAYSGDRATDFLVVKHIVDALSLQSNSTVAYLRPTTPYRDPLLLKEITSCFLSSSCDSLRTIAPASIHPEKHCYLDDSGLIKYYMPSNYCPHGSDPPRQTLPQAYSFDGYLDILRLEHTFFKGLMYGRHVMPYVIDSPSIDIDTESDFQQLLNIASS